MAASGESSRKSKDRKGQTDTEDIDDLLPSASGTDANELETIPTKVPREGDGYQVPRSAMIAQGLGRIGEPGYVLTADDLRRVNTRKGFLKLLANKAVDIEEVRKTLLYEQD